MDTRQSLMLSLPMVSAKCCSLQDDTLVTVKSGLQFPRTAEDYKFFNKTVIQTVQQYHEDGYKIVIFRSVTILRQQCVRRFVQALNQCTVLQQPGWDQICTGGRNGHQAEGESSAHH